MPNLPSHSTPSFSLLLTEKPINASMFTNASASCSRCTLPATSALLLPPSGQFPIQTAEVGRRQYRLPLCPPAQAIKDKNGKSWKNGCLKMGQQAEANNHQVAHNGSPATGSFKLVDFANFVPNNPRSDRFPVKRFHHIEFWYSDATNASLRFSWGLGMPIVAKSDLSTGNINHASYLLRSGHLSFLFSSPYSPTLLSLHDSSTAPPPPIPSFSADATHNFIQSHSLGVRVVAIEVEDTVSTFQINVAHGATPSTPPARMGDREGAWLTEVRLYDNIELRYLSFKQSEMVFLPGFDVVESYPLDYGIWRLDHVVGNVTNLAESVEYVKGFKGFHEFAKFTAEDVGTAKSRLNSVVLANI